MSIDTIIVRLGELTLKGRNRHRFEKRIMSQLASLLTPYPLVKTRTEFGRIYLDLNGESYESVKAQLNRVFGISSFSPARRTAPEVEPVLDEAEDAFRTLPVLPSTFKVSVRRANKAFPVDSTELARMAGGRLLRTWDGQLKVDIHKPDKELKIDIRNTDAYVFTETVPGAGGFPLGSNGKAVLLLSGGIDSPVAGWMTMRRGVEIEAVHFHSYPYTSERAKQKVVELAKRLSQYSDRIKLHLVPFTDIQLMLKEKSPDNLLITLMRRTMLRIAERIAVERKAGAIVTGDSLGQVASQTLASMQVIGSVAKLPLLRPLVMMDKNDIIRHAEEIGTYETSILPFEDCCTLFVPKSPSVNPNMQVTLSVEKALDKLPEAIDEAIRNTESLEVRWTGQDAFDDYF